MSRMVFLLEERSMKTLLDNLLPRLMPGISFICIPHEGKQDLEKSHLAKIGNKSRYRDPDTIQQPSKEIMKLIPEFQKISGARRMAYHLSRDKNCSRSFQVTMDGITHIFKSLQNKRILSQGKK